MNKKLGDRIKEIRIAKNLQPKYMAIEVDVNDTSYAKMEREGTNSVKTLIKIAEALKVSPSELFVDNESSVKEKKKNYGFATKHDIEELKETLAILLTEINALREEIAPNLPAAKAGKKKTTPVTYKGTRTKKK